MNNLPDIKISLYKDDLKIKEHAFNFFDIVNFNLLIKLDSSFDYAISNESCDLMTLYLDDKIVEIHKGEFYEIQDVKKLGTNYLYRVEVKKDEMIKNIILEILNDDKIFSELHLTLKEMIVSKNYFDISNIFNQKIKLEENYFIDERSHLSLIKKSNENINSLLFSLNELRNNLSFNIKKELLKKKDILKTNPYIDFAHSEYIDLNDGFVIAKIKSYSTPENILLVKALNNLMCSLSTLKSLLMLFIKRMNSEIVSYNSLIKSDKKKNISKTNATKLVAIYKSKKILITDLNELLDRLSANIKMILNELEPSCHLKEYDFTSLTILNDKYYKKVFDILSNQLSFNVDFDFLQIALAHSKEKFMLNDLVSFYSIVSLDKVLNDLGYKTNSPIVSDVSKLSDLNYLYQGKKYLVSLECFKFKKKNRNDESSASSKITFVLKIINSRKEVLKTMIIDSYSNILSSNLVPKDYKDDFYSFENKETNFFFEDNLVNKYVYIVLKNSNKFRNDYTYSFRNCSSYIINLYKIFKNYLSSFLEESVSLEELSSLEEM